MAAPEFIVGAADIRLILIDSDLCNACAVSIPGEDAAVVIHTGLIRAIMFHLELTELGYQLHTRLETDGRLPMIEGGLADNFATLIFGASCALDHYASSGVPLPRPGAALSQASKERLFLLFVRSVWFAVVHEIGHIRLGHLRLDAAGLSFSAPALAVAEDMNTDKALEFAADRYVADTLRGRERAVASEYLVPPLDMFTALELRLGGTANTHPVALNRLSAMIDAVADRLDDRVLAIARSSLDLRIDRHKRSMTASTDRVAADVPPIAISALQQIQVGLHGWPGTPPPGSSAILWEDLIAHWFRYRG